MMPLKLVVFNDFPSLFSVWFYVHSVQQKSISLKFSKSRTGSRVTYSCHHNLSRFTFPLFVHSWLLLIMSEKRVANPQKLKTDLAITIESLTLS